MIQFSDIITKGKIDFARSDGWHDDQNENRQLMDYDGIPDLVGFGNGDPNAVSGVKVINRPADGQLDVSPDKQFKHVLFAEQAFHPDLIHQ